MNNLILGTGPLGLAVMDELVARGESVTLVNRSGHLTEPLPAGVQLVAGDAANATQIGQLARTMRAVFLCVGLPYTQWVSQFPAIVRGVIEGVAQSQAVLVFGDNLYGYGDPMGEPLHESRPLQATGRKGRLRAELADWMLMAHRQGRLNAVIGRASDYYGPRVKDSALGSGFFSPALTGKTATVLGGLDIPHTYSFIRDVASSLVTLSHQPDSWGRAWHIPNAEPVTFRQLVGMTERFIDPPLSVRTVGRVGLRLVGWFNPLVREMNELIYEFEKPFLVSHQDYQTAFGSYPTPWEEGLAETVQWYRQYLGQPVFSPAV